MIQAGQYDYHNTFVRDEKFEIEGQGKSEIEVVLFHHNDFIEIADVLLELERSGLRPATVAELLAFGATYMVEQLEFSIVALGSSFIGIFQNPYYPLLEKWNGPTGIQFGYHHSLSSKKGDAERFLDLCAWSGGCEPSYRFAAISFDS